MTIETEKNLAAVAALAYLKPDMIVGVGSGSTVDFFIAALSGVKHKIQGAVASSERTAQKLSALSIPVIAFKSAR
jgi:ribose 5-phosphate isomerase A